MVYWMVAALLIIRGYTIAAFVSILLCVDLNRLSDHWLTHLDPEGHCSLIQRELCVLFISIFLSFLGHEASAVVLFFLGTRQESFRLEWMIVGDQVATSGCFLIAWAAITLMIKGQTRLASGLIFCVVLASVG